MARPRKNGKTGIQIIATTMRQHEVMTLRLSGLNLEQIGEKLGISPQAAHENIMRGLEKYRGEISENVETLRMREIARLDALLNAAWPKAMLGQLSAIDTCIRISERRARLLGLDAPQKIAQTDPTGQQSFGVLVIPQTLSPDEWDKQSSAMRTKMITKEAANAEQQA